MAHDGTRPVQLPRVESSASEPLLEVLIVDDDAATCRALEVGLGHLGNLCFSAGTFTEAVSLLKTVRVDVLVCDYHLPDGNAIDLLERFPETLDTPTRVLITCDPRPEICARARAGGYAAYFQKPLNVEQLCQTLRALTSARRSAP